MCVRECVGAGEEPARRAKEGEGGRGRAREAEGGRGREREAEGDLARGRLSALAKDASKSVHTCSRDVGTRLRCRLASP